MNGAAAATSGAEQGVLRIVGYDHGGYIAWGWWKGWDGPGGVKDSIRRSLARLDRFPGLKWGFHVDGATWDWALANDPCFVAEFLDAVDGRYRGRISLSSGGYGQPLSWTIGGEANIRHLVLDHEVYRRLGRPVAIYMQNEHGFFPQMPQLLRGVGIDKAILRTVWGMYGICPEIDASRVRWRAPDGTWVHAIPTYRGGNRGLGKNAWDTRIGIGLEGPIDFAPFRAHYLEHGIRAPVAVRIDDFGLPKEEDGSGGFDRLCSFSARPGYRWLTGEEAFEEVPAEDVVLDTRLDDYDVQMPWGYMGNAFWNLSRRAECALRCAETAALLNAACGGAAWEAALRSAWKDLLVAQHHDINICGVSSGGEYGEFLFDVARRLYGDAIRDAETVTASVLRSMCIRSTARAARAVVVFNPLSWDRASPVEITVKHDGGSSPAGFRVTAGGRDLPYQVVRKTTEPGGFHRTTTLAVTIPVRALGFASAEVAFDGDGARRPQGGTVGERGSCLDVEAPWGTVSVDRRTGELSVTEASGALLLGPGSGALNAQIQGIQRRSCMQRLEVAAPGPVFVRIRCIGSIGALPFSTDLTVYREMPRLDFRTTVDVHGESIGAVRVPAEWEGKDEPMDQEKKLCVGFAPALRAPVRVLQDAPFSVDCTAKRVINAGLWVSLSDGERGMTLSNRGTMGYIWDGRELRNILLYSGLYSWGERHAFLDGSFANEYSVTFHRGGDPVRDALRAGWEYNVPPVAASSTPRGGALDVTRVGIDLLDPDTGKACDGLLASAAYTAAGQPYLRLYEPHGAGPVRVRAVLCGTPAVLVPVDLLHAETGPGRDTAEVPSHGIRTYRLETGGRK